MAFLLLLHEKMRLKRQVNKLTLKQLRYGSRLDRMTKNIERVQKMYSKKQSYLQKQAQMMQSQASVFFQNMMGVGAQNQMFNPTSYMYGSPGMTTAAAQIMSMWTGGDKWKDKDGKEHELSSDKAQALWKAYVGGQLVPEKDADGKVVSGSYTLNGEKIAPEEYAALQNAMQTANTQVQQRQMMAQQMGSQYQSNISIWLQAQEAQLEAEQDAALAPLEMEQTDMELEKDSIETQLEYARERLKNIEQACKEEIQDSAPKFGLG